MEKARYVNIPVIGKITNGLIIREPNNCPVNAAARPRSANVVAMPTVYDNASTKLRRTEELPCDCKIPTVIGTIG